MSLKELASLSEHQRDWLGLFMEDNGMRLSPRIGFNYLQADADTAQRITEEIEQRLMDLRPWCTGPIVMTEGGGGHRFDELMPLEAKLAKLSASLLPLAGLCARLGTPLGIENHGDYYCSDLLRLCKMTPELYLFLDTGNTYLIGEQPLHAFETAAPYVIGMHVKDHKVRPVLDSRPLRFEVAESPIGAGDVPLRECYRLVKGSAPFPEKLVLEIEMICPPDMNPLYCWEQSLHYIDRLEEDHGHDA
jgi:sugar phosphate isomerase/epimerase